MLTSVTGVYRHGQIILTEQPQNLAEGTHVIITFLTPETIDLAERGIDSVHADELRARLHTFAAEWENPEMDIYNDYDAAKAAL